MGQLTSTPAGKPAQDRTTTRQAALWATVVAVPLTILVAVVAILTMSPDSPAAAPSASPTSARPQSTAPVAIAAPALAERPATVCRALISQLPDTVRELTQRPVQAGVEQNAAYGDPAITIACGVPTPSYPPTDDVYVVDSVCWHSTDESDAVVLTTVDREVPVQVSVPRSYTAALQWLPPFAETLVATVPAAKTVPYGCANG